MFCVFSVVYLKEELKWNYLAGFALMAGGVFVIFKEWQPWPRRKKSWERLQYHH